MPDTERSGTPAPATHSTVHLKSSGIVLDLLSARDVVHWLSQPRESRRLIVGANLHALYLLETEPGFRSVYERANLIIADGFPVAKAAALASPRGTAVHRVGSTDWLENLQHSSRPLRLALVGATPASNAAAVDSLRDSFPAHVFAGWDGYSDLRTLVGQDFGPLEKFDPDVVLIGLGMPRQESWIAEHWDSLPASCTVALVGGAIDHVSGVQRLAPRWLGNLGFEWLWRLAHQPRRLAHRYLIEPIALGFVLARKRIRGG